MTEPTPVEPVSPDSGHAPADREARARLLLLMGTGLLGLSGFVFLSYVGRAGFAESGKNALMAAYFLVLTVGPALFSAVEQDATRSFAELGGVVRAQLRQWLIVVGGLLAVGVIACLVAWPLMQSQLFAGNLLLVLAVLTSYIANGVNFFTRGLLAGSRRFSAYGANLVVDGAGRLVLPLLAGVLWPMNVGAVGFAYALSPVLAALISLIGVRVVDSPEAHVTSWKKLLKSSTAVMVATSSAQAMINLGFVLVTPLMPRGSARLTTFGTSSAISRIPVLASSALQARLLPSFVDAVLGRGGSLSSQLRRVCVLLGAVLVVNAVGMGLLADPVVAIFFHAPTPLGFWLQFGLGCGAILFLATQVLQPALLALNLQRPLAIIWAVGAVAFLGCLLLPTDPLQRALTAQIVGPSVVLLGYALAFASLRSDGNRGVNQL